MCSIYFDSFIYKNYILILKSAISCLIVEKLKKIGRGEFRKGFKRKKKNRKIKIKTNIHIVTNRDVTEVGLPKPEWDPEILNLIYRCRSRSRREMYLTNFCQRQA